MSDTAPLPSRVRGLNFLLAITSLLGAWLLFQVQPMIARRILPWFGGGAAVWTTALLFFQAALFIGYLYAHLVARSLRPRGQVLLHVALLAAAGTLAAVAGVLPSDAWKPESSELPALRILLLLAACVGLPYLMLAATAPLVQVWFSRANPGGSPYRLYAVSNIGSLGALISYPFLVEPNLGLRQQGLAWSVLFIGFAVVCAVAGMLSLRGKYVEAPSTDTAVLPHPIPPVAAESRPRYFFWLALPACAVVMLMAITAYISQHVAPIPLLWILPMVAYLLSFILTFDSDRWYLRAVWMPLAGALSFAAVVLWLSDVTPDIRWMIPVHVGLLFSACMVCHGELARMRPPVERLTTYYLCIAGGGALGGLFTGILAPLVLPDQYELHLSVLAAWALAIAALVTDRRSPFFDGGKGGAFAGLLTVLALLVGLTSLMVSHVRAQRGNYVAGNRNFYGVLTIIKKGDVDAIYELTNGHISHGGQSVDPINHRVPMWYYHIDTGIGKTFLELKSQSPRRVGLVGLGAGALASYGEKGDEFHFYEINPQVVDFAENFFTFLSDAEERGCEVKIHIGDARLVLERQEPQNFDILVLDAFNGDSIPVHLLTMEAVEQYLRHLDQDGILAIHVSNVYLELNAVVKAIAEQYGLEAAEFVTSEANVPVAGSSSWILLHRREGYFSERNFGGPLADEEHPLESVPWTDDHSNLLEILDL